MANGRTGRLAGRVAIVTGAGSQLPGIGNGRAAAVLFAREGAKVVLVDNVAAAAKDTLEMVAGEGGEGLILEADVTNAEDCRRVVAETGRRFGPVTILHNNVGIDAPGSVVDTDEAFWDKVMAVNVKSMMLMSKHAVPVMAGAGGGSIVNISSISALRPRGLTPYSTSKGAVIALTQAMAVDHAPQNVRVNCIVPGPVFTPMVQFRMTPELRERRKMASPLGIEGTGWDIGWAAVFLHSEEARWVTGLIMPVDGGVTLVGPSR